MHNEESYIRYVPYLVKNYEVFIFQGLLAVFIIVKILKDKHVRVCYV